MNQQTTITTKEVYERLIVLETKFDLMDKHNQRMDKKFTSAVVIVVILECINILVHMFVKTQGM